MKYSDEIIYNDDAMGGGTPPPPLPEDTPPSVMTPGLVPSLLSAVPTRDVDALHRRLGVGNGGEGEEGV